MNRKNNILKIFIVIFCLAAVTVFALYESGINIPFMQNYKNNFKRNISGISNMLGIELPIEVQLYLDDMSTPSPKPTMTPAEEQNNFLEDMGYPVEDEIVPQEGTTALTTKKPFERNSDNLPIAFSSAENAKFAVYNGNILCVNETEYSAFSQKGELLFKEKLQMQSPSLTVKGDYVLINETDEKKISLYKGKKQLFTTKTEGNIITADVSENGDIVAVTEKEYYKGQVVVYNKSGKLIFAWDSGSYNILDAAISEKRQVAVSMLNTDSGADSFISCFSVNGETRYKTDNFSDSIVFDLEFDGEKLNGFADNKCFGISQSGKTAWCYDFGTKKLNHYKFRSGRKILVFDAESTGEIVAISSGGKIYNPIKTESMPDTVDIKSTRLAYNSGRDVILTDLNGKKILKTSCNSDIKQLYIIDSNHILAVYSSSIQIKKLSKPQSTEPTQVMENTPVPEEN